MDLTILGADGTYPSPGGACSGYLVREQGFALWMDAGNGTIGRLQRHVALDEVGAVFLSHGHPDHITDLYPFYYARRFYSAGSSGPLPVFAPPGVRERFGSLLDEGSRSALASVFDWREVAPGDVVEAGPLRLRMFETRHALQNAAVRIESNGNAMCYSGDTGPHPELARAADGAALFLCEATWQEQDRESEPIHMRASEAGAAARDAGAGALVLTHIVPARDSAVSRDQASETYGAEVSLATDTETWTI